MFDKDWTPRHSRSINISLGDLLPDSVSIGTGGVDFGYGGGGKRNYNLSGSESSSFGYGGSSSHSQSSSYAEDFGTGVWGVQSPYLADLYGQAQNIFQSGGNQSWAQGLLGEGSGAIQSLLNPGPNPLMEVYQRQMQQGLEQNILPTIRREAMGGNMIGGTRQGVAEGMAAQEAINAQSEFAARLYNEDRNRMLGTLTQMPGIMSAGMGVPWYGAQQYAGILGSPTTLDLGSLSTSQSTSQGSSSNVSGSESRDFSASGKRDWVEQQYADRGFV